MSLIPRIFFEGKINHHFVACPSTQRRNHTSTAEHRQSDFFFIPAVSSFLSPHRPAT